MKTDCTLLVAEDDIEDQMILEQCLTDNGFTGCVSFVMNGRNVIDHLDAVDGNFPKLIVLDLNMPILNGTQTLFELKNNERYAKIPVIIYSTSNNEYERRKCLNFGASDYLVKPVSMEEGTAMTRRLMEFL